MEKLKLGDVVFLKCYKPLDSNQTYLEQTVIRLTKTLAVLDNGTRLVNEPNYFNNYPEYGSGSYGNQWSKLNK